MQNAYTVIFIIIKRRMIENFIVLHSTDPTYTTRSILKRVDCLLALRELKTHPPHVNDLKFKSNALSMRLIPVLAVIGFNQ